jgi:exodeoxyribonuclease V alpha subunit
MGRRADVNDAPALATWLADLCSRLAPQLGADDRALLRATIALLCQKGDEGHVCTSLGEWQKATDEDFPFPPVAAWRERLLATGLCTEVGRGQSSDEGQCPLVLGPGDRLYLLRHWRNEQRLAAFLRQRLGAADVASPGDVRAALEATGLLASPKGAPDWQLAAIATAASRPFSILCGGPGTGKTTTIARLLAVASHLRPGLRIAVAAPTGKAAARLGEVLREAAAGPGRDTPPIEAQTLHRLLGYLPLDDAFRRGPDRPLPYDLVVVDEVSMVDPAVLATLFDALLPQAQLLLVGDKDQLAAVAVGHVLGDLCRSAKPELGVGPRLAAFVQAATGMQLPLQPDAAPAADATITLVENHRFGAMPGIGTFAAAMAGRDAPAAMQAVRAGHADLVIVGDPERALRLFAEPLLAAASAPDRDSALQHLRTARVLTASHRGPHGAIAWNRRIERLLRENSVRVDDPWYHGRPVLITANDHQNRIWNGDLGVVVRAPGERPLVWFPTVSGEARSIAPARLPPHETAWAMTVHKAQGSEFEHVLLSMPDRAGPLWQASLVYTGVTRARKSAIVLADEALLEPSLSHWPARSSGLVDAIG